MRLFIVLFLIVCLNNNYALAGYGLENRIDENGVYCEALGMAKAYTSFAQGLSGLYYNPAGIGLAPRSHLNLFFTRYFDSDAGYSFIGSDFKIRNYAVAAGLVHYRVENIPVRDEYGNLQRQTAADEINFRAGTSKRFKKDFYYGGLLEFQRNSYDGKVRTGLGLGVGLMYRPIEERLQNLANFINNAQMQLQGIVDILYKELKETLNSQGKNEIRNKIKNILRIYPEHAKTIKIFKELVGDDGKISFEELVKEMNPYTGLEYELQNFLSKEDFSDTDINRLYFRGFEYYNRGELYAALRCWETVRFVLQRTKWKNRFSVGVFIKNIFGPDFGVEKYPTTLKFGAGYYILPEKLRAEMDVSIVGTVQKSIHIGGEFLPIKQLALRAGIGESKLFLGFGLKFVNFDLNYVYEPFELGGYHKLDVNYYFGKTNFEKAFTFMQLGRLSMDEEDYFNAEKNFKRCLEIDPSFTIAYYYLEKVAKEVKKAKEQVKELVREAEDYAQKEDYISAVFLLEKAVKINPEDGEAVSLLEKIKSKKDYFEKQLDARIQNSIRNKDYLETEKYLLELLKKQPTNKDLKEKLAVLRAHKDKTISEIMARAQKEFKAGKFFNARNIIEEALKIDPENPMVKEKYEQVLDKIAELTSAQWLDKLYADFISEGKKALEADELSDAIIKLNRALSIKPKSREAFKLLKEAVKKYSQDVDKPYQEAMKAYSEGKYKEAMEKLGLVLTVEPKHPMALKKVVEVKNAYEQFLEDSYKRAKELLSKEKYPEAIKLLQTILDNEPAYKDVATLLETAKADYEVWKKKEHERKLMKMAKPRFKRGLRYMQEGRLTDAIIEFNEAVKIYNKHYKAFYNMGICYDMLGQPEMAIAAYKKAIQANPDFARAYHNLGVVYFMLGNKKDALDNLYKATELDPDYKKTKELIKIIKQNE